MAKKRTKIQQLILTSFIGFLCVGIVEAKVYRWVDDAGIVHYGDRADETKKSVEIKTDNAPKRDKFADERLKRQKDYINGIEEKAEKPKSTKAQLALDEKTRVENCKQVKENLKVLQNLARIYKETENGERHFLSDEEKIEELKIANSQIGDFCK